MITSRKNNVPAKLRLMATLVVSAVLIAASCAANDKILNSGKETPIPSDAGPKKTTFARELDDVRSAGFRFLYVLRRKDGGKLDSEDRRVIREQTVDMNRRVVADEDRAVIIGSNYQLPDKNRFVLFDRFAVEDLSPPPTPEANSNTNK